MHAFPSSCTRKQRRSSAFCMNILGRFWHFKVSYFQPVLCLFQLFCQVLFSCLLLWVCCVVRSTPRQVSTNICRNKVNPTDSMSTWQLTGGFLWETEFTHHDHSQTRYLFYGTEHWFIFFSTCKGNKWAATWRQNPRFHFRHPSHVSTDHTSGLMIAAVSQRNRRKTPRPRPGSDIYRFAAQQQQTRWWMPLFLFLCSHTEVKGARLFVWSTHGKGLTLFCSLRTKTLIL